jgi:hypothetical protein
VETKVSQIVDGTWFSWDLDGLVRHGEALKRRNRGALPNLVGDEIILIFKTRILRSNEVQKIAKKRKSELYPFHRPVRSLVMNNTLS